MTSPPPIRAFQWDLARQVERLDFLLRWLPRYAEWGYQQLYLHLEDAIEYPGLPGVARADAYTYRQFRRLVDAATAAGIRVVPIVNLLGHTQYLIKVAGLRDLNELRDARGRPLERGQICPLHPRTLDVAETLLRDVAPFCTAGIVHVGLDESFHLGRCPRCRAEVSRVGLAGHFSAHVARLHALTRSLGLRLGMWADMLALLPAAIPRLPRDIVAYDWYYYPFSRLPRVELRNFAEIDLATPLGARGIDYWGCPMNGSFRYEPMPIFAERLANIVSWCRRCRRVGAAGFLVTSWEPNRLAVETAVVVDSAAACLWLNPEIEDPSEMLARGIERVLGRRGRSVRRAILAADAHPFAGYHRWQINDRWDVCAGRDRIEPFEKERRALEEPREGLPSALKASLAFRSYLAHRDVFVRRAAQAVFSLRRQIVRGAGSHAAGRSGTGLQTRETSFMDRKVHATQKLRAALCLLQAQAGEFAAALREGRAAARTMWRRSRDPGVRGPNELNLDRDADRLSAWRRWLVRAASRPQLVWQTTPVCGAWQLQFTVHNFAPALQKVVVEQQQSDGKWITLHGLPLIEFRAFAARPRARISREFSVPVEPAPVAGQTRPSAGRSPSTPLGALSLSKGKTAPLHLRIAVRGVGQVAIRHLELTNGVVHFRPRGLRETVRRILGRPARRRGFPQVDLERNVDELSLKSWVLTAR